MHHGHAAAFAILILSSVGCQAHGLDYLYDEAASLRAISAGNRILTFAPIMRIHSKFLISALSPAQFPAPSIPEIAFLGRSNVGKSSLLNALLGSKQAKVSSTPGRTRAINFFSITDTPQRQQPQMYFADLPGYGYAKISKSISAEWPKFIEPYLAERPTLALCLCLVDSNIPPQQSDMQLIEFFKHTGRNYAVVATKADKLSGNGRTKAQATLKKGLQTEQVMLCSAKTGAGLKELWAEIQSAAGKI
jgi:GTP-binding protein